MCGLSAEEINSKKLKCDYCPAMVRSCSMKAHLSACEGLRQVILKEKEAETKEEEVTDGTYNEMGRAVRRSAQKARSSFKELDKLPETKIEDVSSVSCGWKMKNKMFLFPVRGTRTEDQR